MLLSRVAVPGEQLQVRHPPAHTETPGYPSMRGQAGCAEALRCRGGSPASWWSVVALWVLSPHTAQPGPGALTAQEQLQVRADSCA